MQRVEFWPDEARYGAAGADHYEIHGAMMELLEFKHENDPARNRELFGLLGEYATNSVIWEKLGGTISSEPGCCGVRINALRTDTDPHPPFIRA